MSCQINLFPNSFAISSPSRFFQFNKFSNKQIIIIWHFVLILTQIASTSSPSVRGKGSLCLDEKETRLNCSMSRTYFKYFEIYRERERRRRGLLSNDDHEEPPQWGVSRISESRRERGENFSRRKRGERVGKVGKVSIVWNRPRGVASSFFVSLSFLLCPGWTSVQLFVRGQAHAPFFIQHDFNSLPLFLCNRQRWVLLEQSKRNEQRSNLHRFKRPTRT